MRDYEYEDEDEPYVIIEKRSGGMGTFLVGLAVGAGIALLLAPQSGAETRGRISRSARRVRNAAAGAVDDAKDRVQETFETARQRVEEKIDQARGAIEMKRDQVKRAMDAGREAAQQARADLERRLAETKAAYQGGADVARGARRAKKEASRDVSTDA